MKIDAAVGTIDGIAPGASSALAGNKLGAAVGAITGPLGVTLGVVSGACLDGHHLSAAQEIAAIGCSAASVSAQALPKSRTQSHKRQVMLTK